MSLADHQTTLAYHLSRPLFTKVDRSGQSLMGLAVAVEKFMSEDEDSGHKPETSALSFYLGNHIVAEVRQRRDLHEPMSDTERSLVDPWVRLASKEAVRAFYYLMLICLRESRHLNNKDVIKSKIEQKFGAHAASLVGKVSDNGSGAGAHFVARVKAYAPNCTLGSISKALSWQFYNGAYSSGYGGKAWGQVADCLVNFVTGDYTAEMMLDTVWTLCHNNGPIFNKGMLYGHYSGTAMVQRILDVQRSGQIPEMVLTDKAVAQFVTPSDKKAAETLKSLYPGVVKDYVNWYDVGLLGSVNSYPAEKKQQVSLHGLPPNIAEQEKKAAEKAAAEAKAKAEAEAKKFYIMPGLYVDKVDRAA